MLPRDSYFYKWDDDLFTKDQKIYELLIDMTAGLIKDDVLDIGCGSRIYYDTTAVKRWVGMDLSEHLLENVQFLCGSPPKGPIDKVYGSCEQLTFDDDTFDTVCSVFLLHHLGRKNRSESRKAVVNVLVEAHPTLKPGGKMLVLESWPLGILHIYGMMFGLLYPLAKKLLKIELPCFFTSKTLESMALEAGFDRTHSLSAALYEDNIWPVLNIKIPSWIQPFVHKYGVYIFVK